MEEIDTDQKNKILRNLSKHIKLNDTFEKDKSGIMKNYRRVPLIDI